MPRSRKRHKHHHHHTHQAHHTAPHKPKRRSAVPIMVVFIALLGVAVALISSGEIPWLIAGAAAGAVTGFFIGRSMDRVAARNR